MPLIVQRACDSGRIALDRAHFSKKSKRNSTEGTYVYLYLGLVLAEIGRTTFVPPEGLTGGGDSTISLVVRPYGAACGCAAHHGRGRQNVAVSLLYRGGVFFYRTFLRCGTDNFDSRALPTHVLKRYVQ